MRETSSPKQVEFALVLHFHQPVGNFDHVLERVTERSYAPLLEMLGRFPSVRTHLHLNSILLEWFERRRPDLLEIIGRLVADGSAELLGGGRYEPILSVLPEDDAVEQVTRLSDELERRFGRRPVGAWLTERVWEPHLPAVLARSGIRYVTLDDVHFRWAGIEESGLPGHYATDHGGRPLLLVPALKSLRYTIPFEPPRRTFELLEAAADGPVPQPLMVYADDAEKFGEWPGTHEWVFERGWLKDFLAGLGEHPRIRTVHLSERIERMRPLGRAYPPTASYPEMTIWALPTPARARLEHLVHQLEEHDPLGIAGELRGGHWRGFLAKYPEAHRLHKRMLRVSDQLAAARSAGADPGLVARVADDLHRGQCNDAYWHGAFGGLYLPHLRRALEAHLIRAQRSLDRADPPPAVRLTDFDRDGGTVCELATPASRALVDPSSGALLSWDLLEAGENWVGVVQRHREPFHDELEDGRFVRVDAEGLPLEAPGDEEGTATIHGVLRVKPDVEADDLRTDAHPRLAGLLWTAPPGTRPDDPRETDALRRFTARWDLDLAGEGAACRLRGSSGDLRIEQEFRIAADATTLEWSLRAEALQGPCCLLAEWNLLVGWTGDDLECEDGGSFVPRPTGSIVLPAGTTSFRGGGGRRLRIDAPDGTRLSWAPVHTISSSEAGLERVGQGTCFLFGWDLEGTLETTLRFEADAPAWRDDEATR